MTGAPQHHPGGANPWGDPGGAPPGHIATGLGQAPTEKERQWAMLAHLSGLALSFWGPLAVMLLDEQLVGHPSPFVKHAAKQALIFNVATIVIAVLTCGIGALLIFVHILGALRAHEGQWYCYPLLERFAD